ncbi:MAG: LytS/YhcK type 5TM receptor domain-containing protein, partial [Acidimicrobiia bacterium]
MIISLIQNVSLLLAMAFPYDLAVSSRVPGLVRGDVRTGVDRLVSDVATGAVLGTIGIAVMASSWELSEGVILDTRSAMLTAIGLFFGPVPAVIAVAVTAGYRLYLGGAGAPTGVAVIVMTTAVGLAAHTRLRHRLAHVRWYELLSIGVFAHVVMLAMFVPSDATREVLDEIWIPVLVIYPVAFTLVGVLLSRRRRAAEITERVAASEANYRTVFENDHLAMVVIEPATGRFLDVNRRACDYYGYDREELLGMTTSDIEVLPRDEVIHLIDSGRGEGKTSFELQHRLADGEIRDVEVIGGAVTIRGGTRVHAVINDITDRKRAEREL